VSVPVAVELESSVLVVSPLLLQDHITAADKQIANKNNVFFIKAFDREKHKIYAIGQMKGF